MLSTFNEPVRFDAFMQFALFHPQYGYYSRGQGIFGQEGDFITAPEISPLFGKTLGTALLDVLPRCSKTIYELGAGTGQLACDVLSAAGEMIEHYFILDVSGGLKETQQQQIVSALGEQAASKVQWLNTLPDSFNGVVLGNEVLDATPVRRFKWHKTGPLEAWVQTQQNALVLNWKAADPVFSNTINALHEAHGPWTDGYESEIAEQSTALVKTITDRLNGLALMIDYGYHAALYYHPSRTQGTLRATSRHTAHDGFLSHVGEQDLTAHVNFSAMYDALQSCGGELEGYSNQNEFLLAHGILDLAQAQIDFTHPTKGARMRQDLNTLLSEAEMGESFKVICWSKGVHAEGSRLSTAFLAHDRSSDL